MGFNKRYLNDNQVISWLESGKPLETLFNADALIFDGEISSKVHDLYVRGVADEEILIQIKKLD